MKYTKIPMRRPGVLRGKKGYTLVQLIFEIFVLAVVVIPTIVLLGHLSVDVSDTEANSTASLLCIQKTEELMWSKNYDTIAAEAGNFSAPYQNYSYQVTVDYVAANNPDTVVSPGPTDYKKAVITISTSGILDVESNALFVKLQ